MMLKKELVCLVAAIHALGKRARKKSCPSGLKCKTKTLYSLSQWLWENRRYRKVHDDELLTSKRFFVLCLTALRLYRELIQESYFFSHLSDDSAAGKFVKKDVVKMLARQTIIALHQVLGRVDYEEITLSGQDLKYVVVSLFLHRYWVRHEKLLPSPDGNGVWEPCWAMDVIREFLDAVVQSESGQSMSWLPYVGIPNFEKIKHPADDEFSLFENTTFLESEDGPTIQEAMKFPAEVGAKLLFEDFQQDVRLLAEEFGCLDRVI